MENNGSNYGRELFPGGPDDGKFDSVLDQFEAIMPLEATDPEEHERQLCALVDEHQSYLSNTLADAMESLLPDLAVMESMGIVPQELVERLRAHISDGAAAHRELAAALAADEPLSVKLARRKAEQQKDEAANDG
jgi:hypothetical protein